MVTFEGPMGKLQYHGYGKFIYLRKDLEQKTSLGLLAAGTGITPLFSVAQASILSNDGLDIKLLYSNKTEDDILLYEELKTL